MPIEPNELSKKLNVSPADLQERKDGFIGGLERAISMGIPEFRGVTLENLREMVDLAKSGDWGDKEVIQALYSRYGELVNEDYSDVFN